MLAILKREIAAYFNSALAWILMAVYMFILGFVFMILLSGYSEASLTAGASPFGPSHLNLGERVVVPTFWWIGFLLLFMLPLLTMRLLAEESRTGTLEMLFTYPLTEVEIVLGKFFAALTVVVSMLGLSAGLFLALGRLTKVEWAVVATGYLGAFLLGCAFISFGMWASSVTSHQMIAGGLCYGGLLMSWLVSIAGQKVESLKELFGDLSVMSHLEQMARGSISTHSFVYYAAWTGLFLFLTVRMLDNRKWSA